MFFLLRTARPKDKDSIHTGCPRRKGLMFWELIVSVSLRNKKCMYMFHIQNDIRERTISLYGLAMRYVLTVVAK
jgi:hypothetical protein